MIYKLQKSIFTGEIMGVQEIGDDYVKSIPFDEKNMDYQEYLKWVAEGNTPLPADE